MSAVGSSSCRRYAFRLILYGEEFICFLKVRTVVVFGRIKARASDDRMVY